MRRSTGDQDGAPAFNLRLELALGAALLAFGLLLLPALIFMIGRALLGGYGLAEDGSISTFYADFFNDLGSFSLRAWLLALGPALTIYALRGIFFQRASADDADEPPTAPRARPATKPAPRAAAPASRRARVEPRLSRD